MSVALLETRNKESGSVVISCDLTKDTTAAMHAGSDFRIWWNFNFFEIAIRSISLSTIYASNGQWNWFKKQHVNVNNAVLHVFASVVHT